MLPGKNAYSRYKVIDAMLRNKLRKYPIADIDQFQIIGESNFQLNSVNISIKINIFDLKD